MQLTKLEIKGFKSFADKVVINFDDGITGIVGPNGCGKSNVVDSIRWVLGEQKTRVLRSEKMENIIFNGTRARKPTQMAEVSLTFDNTKNLIPTEYSQVTITRRYYRSGESEYMLNGVTCRLKDITNLFMDTGIASNSYAIIELKMVDDLLNDKDNSRRSLFEEAAGISKFKKRKKETLKKLDDTDADLERVEDLLFEIEKNLKSLERQAKQAKRYYALKDEHKKMSLALAKKSMTRQEQRFEEINTQITQETDKKLALNTSITENETAIQKAKNELVNKEKTLASRQKTLNEHVSKIRQYESDKKIKNERQKFLQDKIESLTQQINTDKESSERTNVALSSLKTESEEILGIIESASEQLETLKFDYEEQKAQTNEARELINVLNSQTNQKRELQFQLNKDIEIKEIQLRSLNEELNKTSEDSEQQNSSLEEFESRLRVISEEKSLKDELHLSLQTKKEATETEIESSQARLQELKDNLTKINRKADAKKNEYSLTKSLVDNLEGFPEAIKFLKKNPKWKNFPLLSDVLGCPEEHRIAVENYLEPYMNYYVVNTYDDAITAIQLLSDASRGKAHFFVLERLENYTHPSQKNVNNATPVIEVLDFDSKYYKLIQLLLHNVYLCSDITKRANETEIILLDNEGKITQRPFSLSGGSVGLFEGKRIGRAKNLEKLDAVIKELAKEKSKIGNEIEQHEEKINTLKSSIQFEKLNEIKSELMQLNEMKVSLESKLEQFTQMISTNKNRRENIQLQIQEIQDALEGLKPQAEDEKAELEEMLYKLEENQAGFSSLQEAMDLKSALYNEQNVLFLQKQNKQNSILQEISFKQETYENTIARIEKSKADLELTTNQLNELMKKTTANDDELISMYEEKESLEIGVNEAEKSYYEGRNEIDEIEKILRETQRQKEGTDMILMEWQNKLNETKMALNSVKDRLSVEFNLDLSNIDDEEIADYKDAKEEELNEKVSKIRTKIDNIGPINSMAMEAFEEVSERHKFVIEQKEDLLTSKESLLSTISEIDEVAKKTFMHAFTEIKTNFIRVFRTLFTEEDDCDLRLTEPDKPLESTIDIIAKPKGKRPLTINQLSGGEKTLTATSLLFSIYLLKPAPFCIFDEVDAPLDDANIDKFNQIIRKFSKESQFIIVTHNKRTMASTDVIYGVTMQEQGVSRLIPVDLRELD